MLSWSLGCIVIGQGMLLTAVGLAAFWLTYDQDSDLASARTMTFCVIVFAELFRAIAARSQRLTFWQLGITTNLYVVAAVVVSVMFQVGLISLPFTRSIFEATLNSPTDWIQILALALTPVTIIELVKLGRSFFQRSNLATAGRKSSKA